MNKKRATTGRPYGYYEIHCRGDHWSPAFICRDFFVFSGRRRRRPLQDLVFFVGTDVPGGPPLTIITKQKINMSSWATTGSLCEFGWLVITNVTSPRQATEARYKIPRRLTPCASASLLAQQKFDSAQDDRLTVYLRCFFQKSLTNPLPRVIIKVSHKLNNFRNRSFSFVGITVPFFTHIISRVLTWKKRKLH